MEEDSPMKVVCYRSGYETREFKMEDWKESQDHLPDFHTGRASGFLGGACSVYCG